MLSASPPPAPLSFYHVNKLHDILYRLGFNDDMGAFQAYNRRRSTGVSGDPVLVEIQDGSGTNNVRARTRPA